MREVLRPQTQKTPEVKIDGLQRIFMGEILILVVELEEILVGESRRAWEELEKSVVITHKNATLTSFVMPNSYCENEEYFIDGDSLSDWHTGSGCVLVKETVRYGFGIYPTLDGVRIQTPKFFPAKSGEIRMKIRDTDFTLTYEDRGEGSRRIEIDGAEYEESFDELMGVPVCFIPADKLSGKVTVRVTD